MPRLRVALVSYAKGDMVRIVKDDPNKNNRGSMLRSYRGADAKVIEQRDDGLYRIEVDQPYAIGGAPNIIVKPVMIGPDVTQAMLRAAGKVLASTYAPDDGNEEYLTAIYRAMRAARFEP